MEAEETYTYRATMHSLLVLLGESPGAYYELVVKCRDQNHQISDKAGEVLRDLGFLQPEGSVSDNIRDVVLSAIGIPRALRAL